MTGRKNPKWWAVTLEVLVTYALVVGVWVLYAVSLEGQ